VHFSKFISCRVRHEDDAQLPYTQHYTIDPPSVTCCRKDATYIRSHNLGKLRERPKLERSFCPLRHGQGRCLAGTNQRDIYSSLGLWTFRMVCFVKLRWLLASDIGSGLPNALQTVQPILTKNPALGGCGKGPEEIQKLPTGPTLRAHTLAMLCPAFPLKRASKVHNFPHRQACEGNRCTMDHRAVQ